MPIKFAIRAACGCRIGMCGYASVSEDGRTCYICSGCVKRWPIFVIFGARTP